MSPDAGRDAGWTTTRDGTSGTETVGAGVAETEHREVSIEALHRMITYVRQEAVRLRVMDVAVLLEHAEDVVTAFAPAALESHGRAPSTLDVHRVEH